MKISQRFLDIKDGTKFLMITLIFSQKSPTPNISVASVQSLFFEKILWEIPENINNYFGLFATHSFTNSVDRDELFEKARGEILDEVINLSLVSSQTWEDAISKKLWQKVAPFVFENIYLPAAAMTSDSPERPISTYNKTGKNLSKLVETCLNSSEIFQISLDLSKLVSFEF